VKLVAGLGNPGKEYESTRHNVGFRAIDRLAVRLGRAPNGKGVKFRRKYLGSFAIVPFPNGDEMGLLKPRTFMNRSGRSVGKAVREIGIETSEVVIIHDDLDLPLGKIRVKFGGGAGGHKGIKNITDTLGTPDFVRLRIGIDKPVSGDATDYVLGGFDPAETVILENEVLPLAADAIMIILSQNAQEAMNKYNG